MSVKNGGNRNLYHSFVDISPLRGALEAGQTVLTPGRRLARQFTTAWLSTRQQNSAVAEHPRIEPVDAWLEARWFEAIERGDIPEQKLLSRVEERLVWLSVINADTNYGEAFRLLQPQAAAEQARICRDAVLHFASDGGLSAFAQYARFDVDCRTFVGWLKQFDKTLEARGWATRADAYGQLTHLQVNEKPTVLLTYALDLSPLTWRAIHHLARVSSTDHDITSASVAPIRGPRFATVEDELAHIAAWAAQRHKNGRQSTAIVLMNFKRDRPLLEYYLRREFDCLDARYSRLPVDFATGQPLASVPMFRDALLALTLHTEPLTRRRVEALLRSPYVLEPDFFESKQGIDLVKALFDLGTDPIDWADFSHCVAQKAADSHLAQIVPLLRAGLGGSETCDLLTWAERLRSSLKLWRWPSRNALDSMEYQQLDRFERSLDQLAALSEVAGKVGYSRAVALWQSCLDDLVFQPKTEPSALQVLGPQEAIGLCFDTLHVCGLQAGVLPSTPRLLPFIPAVLQRQWAIPNADATQLLKQAQALIACWRMTHGKVSGSSYGWSEGVEQRSSSLFEARQTYPVQDRRRPSHWRAWVDLEWVDDSTTEGLVHGPEIPFGGGASVLQNQSACAFRAWMRHRLGANALPAATLGLTAAERGLVIHNALYYFWGSVGGSSELGALSNDGRKTLIADAVGHAIRSLEASTRHGSVRKRVGSACLDIESARAQALLDEWLTHEQKRAVSFIVAEREQPHTLTIGDLELSLRPDRIDELQDGRRLVIDYKTGRPTRGSWLGQRPSDPQLPIYALLDEGVRGLAFARVRRAEMEFIALGDELGLKEREQSLAAQLKTSPTPVDNWASLSAHWRATLEGFASAYARGDAHIDPAPGACRYCDLASVCRVGHQYGERLDEDGQSVGDDDV